MQAQRQLGDMEEEFGLSSLCNDFQTSHLYMGLPEEKDTNEESEEKENVCQDFLEETEYYQNSTPEDVDKKNALVDLLREKFTEKRTEINTMFSDFGSVKQQSVELSIFKNLAIALSTYRSGNLPKAFKAIPRLRDWEQLLYLTEPDNWTAAAMFQATRLFASNLKSEMAQRFYNLILLPRIRDEISQCKELNHYLYMAVEKATYKPRAFFRGIIIPLCESGNCSKQEAIVLSSVISKRTIPALQSSIALFLISRLEFSCANCIFMRVLIEKKYALAVQVIDAVVDYFLKFAEDRKALPVLWHNCFLELVRNYKNDLSQDQKQELLKLLKIQKHHKISVEISKELLSTICQNKETSVNMTN